MTGRITTRAGRKIRHVAPGHVVDVATGVAIKAFPAPKGGSRRGLSWWVLEGGSPPWGRVAGLDHALVKVARGEAVCALVRAMIAIGGAS